MNIGLQFRIKCFFLPTYKKQESEILIKTITIFSIFLTVIQLLRISQLLFINSNKVDILKDINNSQFTFIILCTIIVLANKYFERSFSSDPKYNNIRYYIAISFSSIAITSLLFIWVNFMTNKMILLQTILNYNNLLLFIILMFSIYNIYSYNEFIFIISIVFIISIIVFLYNKHNIFIKDLK